MCFPNYRKSAYAQVIVLSAASVLSKTRYVTKIFASVKHPSVKIQLLEKEVMVCYNFKFWVHALDIVTLHIVGLLFYA